ncbi:methylenetetrahydrofolate--tRNA-(uracil(54)-C(5))-methyltransferase (FADH(2)-oxidizing) TrmFO [soil metagenome]
MIHVVGAGFAGVEAAWALAERGEKVRIYEMRPVDMTPAHTTGYFAELVCSNSLKSKLPTSPAGQLKAEMHTLGSIVLKIAEATAVPAGEALGVDRTKFGEQITAAITNHPNVEVRAEKVTPDEVSKWLGANDKVILATGPLTTPELADWLAQITGRKHLYFYDAVSPTLEASSIDRSIAFAQSRYDKGEGDDYLNCPFDKATYQSFVHELVHAERAPIHAFEAGGKRDLDPSVTIEDQFLEKIKYFAGCTPIEAIAEKGERSLAFGNFKPVGLTDPRTGRRPWAALQLRPENNEKTLYSLVACQTRLKWGEQKRIFQMVPGLENAEFVRFGVIHRNTYLEAPTVLADNLSMRDLPNLFIAGQLTGVEGYVESAAMGIYVALAVLAKLKDQTLPIPGREYAYGSLISQLTDQTPREFAPMNINWGLFPTPEGFEEGKKVDKGKKREARISNAQKSFAEWHQRL